MRMRKVPTEKAAHFLMKQMFCMFAEDIELLPDDLLGGTKLLLSSKTHPAKRNGKLQALFEAMAAGGNSGADPILHGNGGLFVAAEVIPLTPQEIAQLIRVNEPDWTNVEPSIFSTLFERTMDPAKRSKIRAHYTSNEVPHFGAFSRASTDDQRRARCLGVSDRRAQVSGRQMLTRL
jgi:hypothetical protein